jgi:hypothetical protein
LATYGSSASLPSAGAITRRIGNSYFVANS